MFELSLDELLSQLQMRHVRTSLRWIGVSITNVSLDRLLYLTVSFSTFLIFYLWIFYGFCIHFVGFIRTFCYFARVSFQSSVLHFYWQLLSSYMLHIFISCVFFQSCNEGFYNCLHVWTEFLDYVGQKMEDRTCVKGNYLAR